MKICRKYDDYQVLIKTFSIDYYSIIQNSQEGIKSKLLIANWKEYLK